MAKKLIKNMPEEKICISDLENNRDYELILGVTEKGNLADYKDQRNAKWANVVFVDKTGRIDAKLFGDEPEGTDIKKYLDSLEIGKIYAQ